MLAPQDGKREMVELSDKLFFAPAAVGVADGVEARGVGHFAEMGEFMADDVVPQFRGEEEAYITKVYVAARRAFPHGLEAAHYSPRPGSESQTGSYLPASGEQDGGRHGAGDVAHHFRNGLLHFEGVEVELCSHLDICDIAAYRSPHVAGLMGLAAYAEGEAGESYFLIFGECHFTTARRHGFSHAVDVARNFAAVNDVGEGEDGDTVFPAGADARRVFAESDFKRSYDGMAEFHRLSAPHRSFD